MTKITSNSVTLCSEYMRRHGVPNAPEHCHRCGFGPCPERGMHEESVAASYIMVPMEAPLPPPEPVAARCGNCMFIHDGNCRRRSPTAVDASWVNPSTERRVFETATLWPAVKPDDWCGDHQPLKVSR